jgi:hypothetical protein
MDLLQSNDLEKRSYVYPSTFCVPYRAAALLEVIHSKLIFISRKRGVMERQNFWDRSLWIVALVALERAIVRE